MKVLFVDQPLEPPGGGQVSLLTLVETLKRKIYSIKVFLPYKCSFVEMLKEKNVEVEIVPVPMLLSKIKKTSPDIIHCNAATTKYTFVTALAAKMFNIPFIWHNRVVEAASWKEKLIAKLASKIVVVSDKVKDKFKNFESKVVKIYNPVDTEMFKPNLNTRYLFEELKILPGEKIIGIFSRIDWWKGHKLAITAFAKLTDELKNLKLLIVGDGPCRDEVVNYAKSTKVDKKILFLGFRKDIPELMNICDVILNPSTEPEPFGRTIIEAMACGKVVIATGLGGVTEIINHLVDGILIKPDEDELKKYLKLVLTDENLYRKISENALLKSKEFSKEKHCEKIIRVYCEVLNQ